MRYAHEASGRVRGFLPLNDACCSDVSYDGHHVALLCVPSKMLPPLACCTVDQEATAAGDAGFKFKDNGQHVVFPNGPTTLLANQIVGDTKASRADCEAAYWTFEMSNNSCAFCYS